MTRVFQKSVTITIAALLIAAAALPAQDRGDVRLGITYTPGYQPGLVMTAVEANSAVNDIAEAAEEILRRDLTYADRFEVIPVPDSLTTVGVVNYALWNQLGAVWLVSSEMSGTPDAPVLRVSLHDVVFGELKEVQAFFLPALGDGDFRMAVHRVSDQVVQWATGDPGIAATRIVFRRKTGDGSSDIYAIDYDGENLRRLTSDNTIVYSPALSPNGEDLLYVSYREGTPKVYERNLSSGRTSLISGIEGLNVTPIYSPDGRKIVLARTAGDHTELYEFGRSPLCCMKRLTHTNAGETLNAAYSPSGDQLAITSSPLGNPQIYVMSAAGGAPQLISRYVFGERGYATSPDWSPRGNRITYQAWIENTFQVVTVNPNGGDRRVMTSAGSNEDPSWAPDGRHLVFASAGRRGNTRVRI
jgi:TolB protein